MFNDLLGVLYMSSIKLYHESIVNPIHLFRVSAELHLINVKPKEYETNYKGF
jgi:hypothetical protein